MNKLLGDVVLVNFVDAVKTETKICTSIENNIEFSSCCNFRFYDTDFLKGKPSWASIYSLDKLSKLL